MKKFIFFAYCAIFPFGQIPSLLLSFASPNLHIFHLSDFLVLSYVFISLLDRQTLKMVRQSKMIQIIYCVVFCSIAGSLLFNFYSLSSVLYLLRLIEYLLFGLLVFRDDTITKKELSTFFIVSGIVVSTIGLVQYFLFPDTRMLKVFGWDDHYYRLISTFLDPAFTGIILVFSFLYVLLSFKKYKKYSIFLLILFGSSLLLTYSRASYVALIFSLNFYALKDFKISRRILVIGFIFLTSIFFIPRPNGSEGVNLMRTFSLFSKIKNSQDTMAVFTMSPVFGVGYNNICEAKTLLSIETPQYLPSHSCSGADNSILFLLATTGFVGTLLFVWFVIQLIKSQNKSLLTVVLALAVHTQFTNTLFYPWVVAWMILFIKDLSLKE